jgi:hypothetical protein
LADPGTAAARRSATRAAACLAAARDRQRHLPRAAGRLHSRLLPDSVPPWRTVHRWFARLRDGGVLEAITHHLLMLDRERAGREASPTAAVIDRQSV